MAKLLHDLQIAGSTNDGAIQGYLIGKLCSISRDSGSYSSSNTSGARSQQLPYLVEHRVMIKHQLQV